MRTPKWEELGIQQKLDDVDRKERKTCTAMYQLWLEEKGSHATRRVLLAALRDIRQNEVADNYVDYLKKVSDIVKDNLLNIFLKLHC